MDQQEQAYTILNNAGVSHFQAKDLSSALFYFRKALHATASVLSAENSVASEEIDLRFLGSVSQAPSGVRTKPSPEDRVYVYDRAINLVPLQGAYSPDPLVNATVISCIILFNLALVYHVKGIEGADNRSAFYLFKAKSLYHKSLNLLGNVGISPFKSVGHAVLDILIMAILNNCGHCHHFTLDYLEARKIFQSLVEYASSMTHANHHADVETASLLEWHKSIFLVNACTLKPPQTASAA